ncbi:MAG: extracellular solute-binding protein [Clostridiaceae bacterium]
MKRHVGFQILVVLIAAFMMLSTFACAAAPAATETTEATEAPAAEPTEEAAPAIEPVTIEFWHGYSESDGQIAVLDELISQFEAANPGITVEPVFMEWSALHDGVVAGATTGTLPDVLRGDIAFVPQFGALNVLVDMGKLPGYADVAASVLPSANSTTSMNGGNYGLAANTNTKILYYNKTMLDAAGLAVPTTQEEMWNTATALSADGKFGFVEAWTGWWNVGPYIWSNGGDVLSPDNTTATGYINGEAAVATIQKLADLYAAKVLTGPTMDPGAVGDTDGWASGTYAMEVDGPWRGSALNSAGIEYGAVALPKGTASSTSVLGGEDFMMFTTSSEAEQAAAWKFIQFMASEAAQVAMAKVGQMPVSLAALQNADALAAMPLLPVYVEALQTAKSRPVIPQWSEIEGIVATKASEAITGVKDAQTAMDEAATEINALLAG